MAIAIVFGGGERLNVLSGSALDVVKILQAVSEGSGFQTAEGRVPRGWAEFSEPGGQVRYVNAAQVAYVVEASE